VYTVFGYLTRKSGLTMDEFTDYYESRHVPLILSLAPAPLVYKRRYIAHEDTQQANQVDFDVMTEVGFSDQAAFSAWLSQLFSPQNGDRVAKDEEVFLDRAKTKAHVIHEHITAG